MKVLQGKIVKDYPDKPDFVSQNDWNNAMSEAEDWYKETHGGIWQRIRKFILYDCLGMRY